MHAYKIIGFYNAIRGENLCNLPEVRGNSMMEKIYRTIVKEIKKELPNVQGIYLFGSYATSQQQLSSDLDIAILMPHPINNLQRWQLAQHLASMLHKEVDLVDLQCASTVMQFQIVRNGKRLFSADFAFCEHFEDKVFQLYLTLNDDRKPILDEVKKTGKIYG